MLSPRARGVVSVLAVLAAAACGSGTSEPPPTTGNNGTPTALVVQSGNGQTGLISQPLSLPLTVKVTSAGGDGVKGQTVVFAVTSGSATLSPSSVVTDTTGIAKTNVTFGSTAGTVVITATVSGTALSTSFVATAGSGTITAACTASSAQTLAVGGVTAGLPGTGICLAGAVGGADYAIVAFNTNPDSNLATASFTVRSAGATALSTASVAPAFASAPLGSPLLAATASANMQASFDAGLRAAARRDLTPLMPAARQIMRSRGGAALNTIPSTLSLGQMITLNASTTTCSNPINVRARVAAITSTAIIVADSLNPTGGFSDAEYASFGTTFDTLVNPLDVTTFGQPSDIDKNGKVVILFTKEVNKLTPKNATGFIGGFFIERDLFPTTATAELAACPTSNVGEMFYVLVPDPDGTFNNVRTKQDVLDNTIPTLAHEYQHLINAGRRLYVNNAFNFESVWLNEGLSHIAEELLYYRVAGKAPRQNVSISDIKGSQVAIFNTYATDNISRFELFIAKPSQTSVYPDNDELETRGATWNMLRYLADHRGTSDGDVWNQLVNTTVEGHLNLAHVFGASYMTQIRDWATSVFSDDVPGVTNTTFLAPSWNFRSIFPALCTNPQCTTTLGKYPLTVVPLSDASPANLGVVAGGEAYLRFTVPAGGQASIDWSSGTLPVTPFVQFTVVRTR